MRLISTNPRDGGIGVSPTGPLEAVFSDPIDGGSVAFGPLLVIDSSGEVAATDGVVSGATLRLFPFGLPLASKIVWNIPSVSSATATFPGATQFFTTRDGQWQAPTLAEPDGGTVSVDSRPTVAIDLNGDGLFLWTQESGNYQRVHAARYTAMGDVLGPPIIVSAANPNGHARAPRVSLNDDGDGVAVWEQYDGLFRDVWAATYVRATDTWSAPVRLDTAAGDVSEPKVGVDAVGNAYVVWVQASSTAVGARTDVWGTRFAHATRVWQPAALLETNDLGFAFRASIGVARTTGGAVVAWSQHNGTRYDAVSIRAVTFASAYAAPVLLETSNAGDAFVEDVVADGTGRHAVAFTQPQLGASMFSLYVTRFETTTGLWSGPELVETNEAATVSQVSLAADATRALVVTWTQADGLFSSVWANDFTQGSWGTARLVEMASTGAASSPRAALGRHGNGVVVFSLSDGTRTNLWASRFLSATRSFGSPVLLEQDDAGNVGPPALAIGPSGVAHCVWGQAESLTRVNLHRARFH